jgi:hypothetical protein
MRWQLEVHRAPSAFPPRDYRRETGSASQSVEDDLKAVASTDENKRSDVQKYLAENFKKL